MSAQPVTRGPDGSGDGVVLTAEVSEQLEGLRRVIDHARSMPMSSSVVVNRSELLGLVDQLEAACRVSIGDAQDVVGRRDEVLAAGREEAQEMIREAGHERDRLVSDTEVFRVATREAEQAVTAAEEEAEALLEETDSYVAERLAAFEGTLDTTLEAVRRGRERLARKPKLPRRLREATTAPGGSESPFAALANDSDVDDINLPEHLDP
jgi:cell division septum initiation protein DivIVA